MTEPGRINIPETDEELLDECDVSTFRSGGKGGQHVNKTESGVRLVHRPTGIVVISRKERSQYLNRKDCLQRLRVKLKKLNEKRKKRIPTRTPVSAVRKRRESKAIQAKKKKMRGKPPIEE